ncbi:non-reducing end alpha-L-arabinofuranosidase family hydrolase [Streptomyces sp. HD]|uniref:non-reducing end alpha-L-arabinofuranosidase family hydrolase n=1 Tax=Streptomyces sp. HD TaxID=3020892 RepID=UPI00232C6FF0|nr:non-reducing end alpha-L-arabinofuranosidase family hydrolase [Streptomyces sp. HD]MDC0766978.1 non-reducing end alpha-L-arabinofuranosidase family hydrolase [Streptomyces sp. HD]
MPSPHMRTSISGPALTLPAFGAVAGSPDRAAVGSPLPDRSGRSPGSFTWSSSGPLIAPKPDVAHPIVSVKDPTVFRHGDRWHVYMTTSDTSGRWSRGRQTGPPSFSATNDPANPGSWSAPRNFVDAEPPIVTENKGQGGRLDFWVICDDTDCYLFSSDGNGHQCRSRTTVAEFPNGFRDTTIVLSEPSRFDLFEAGNVYRLGAGSTNVTFGPGQPAWTTDFSHGEMIREDNDQPLTIDPCRLQYLYQGMDPASGGDYSQLPWRPGLLPQTNSSC